ncbi:hypothetical protein PNEG_00856 [Pneumocystis murina B123]|uniref:Exosome complex protein n=1 Tax=Pneumocystis murina (strain B123) TaxID=1069680 RepID=M7PA17_PNEMU|nr:hypothetical protein PNEG_00856 [Pneumocystis murina B123]EMR10705.1 hypothetical protein PNEG_00856 [Pneumocystis murina B123]
MATKIHPNEGDLNLLIENLKERVFCLENIFFEFKLNDQNNLSELSSKLSMLDKAKLYITLCYAINSLIFMILKLNQVDLKNHAVMKELKRVEEYVLKIKEIEMLFSKRTMALNKQVASRIIAHDLSGNLKNDNKKESLHIQDCLNLNMSSKGRVHIKFEESNAKLSETCLDAKQIKIEKDIGTSTKHFQDLMISMGSYSKTQNRTSKKQKKYKTSEG